MAPTLEGTSSITIAEDMLIESLSRSNEFHDFTGTNHEMESRARIYCIEIPGTDTDNDQYSDAEWLAMFPCVIIGPPEDGGSVVFRHEATDDAYWAFVRSFIFTLRFERYFPPAYDEQDAVRDLQNRVGLMMEELVNQSGYPGRFGVSEATPIGPPQLGSYARYASLGMIQSWRWSVRSEVA